MFQSFQFFSRTQYAIKEIIMISKKIEMDKYTNLVSGVILSLKFQINV